ncbi:hypothetical protein BDV25DRAFT_140631 [Aspergillus avenaceus]|uniref:gamma-glutamylcyclotransferase n=1 Tax=Aspergillus avenaceus TaxID=36643 RepID=A0A5N6TU31_ASPAV|nr:hypothetical protein BDV25DRAFT_140631 [Aspergillus avenaceus]
MPSWGRYKGAAGGNPRDSTQDPISGAYRGARLGTGRSTGRGIAQGTNRNSRRGPPMGPPMGPPISPPLDDPADPLPYPAIAKYPPRAAAAATYFYFAYGRNMMLEEMASKCDCSILFRRGILKDHRFQINQSGDVNMVRSEPGRSDYVEGILFAISKMDMERLDSDTWVNAPPREKIWIHIQVEPLAIPSLHDKPVVYAAKELKKYTCPPSYEQKQHQGVGQTAGRSIKRADRAKNQKPSWSRLGYQKKRNRQTEHWGGETPHQVMAYMYLNSQDSRDGKVLQDLVEPLENAMEDALKLGISQSYLSTYVYPVIRKPVEGSRKEGRKGQWKTGHPEQQVEKETPEGTSGYQQSASLVANSGVRWKGQKPLPKSNTLSMLNKQDDDRKQKRQC